MQNSRVILSEIEAMLREKNIPLDRMIQQDVIQQRTGGKSFSMAEHIRALIYSQLSNNRRWNHIADSKERIDEIFFYYDKEKILATSSDYFQEKLLEIRCGNRGIRMQMEALHDNIRKFEQIEREFDTLDKFIRSGTPVEIADLLANSLKYKLKAIGLPLAMEYLRNVGIDVAKPDTHICRILGSERLGYAKTKIAGEIEAVEIIDDMSHYVNCSPNKIDALLWLFCSTDNGRICTEKPNCEQCTLRDKQCNWHG